MAENLDDVHNDLVKLAIKIYNESEDDIKKEMKDEDILKKINNTEDYKYFCKAYPLIIKYMVQLRTFDPRAFKQYLEYSSKLRPTAEERAECMNNPLKKELWENKHRAMYVKYLYKIRDKTHNINNQRRIYNETLDILNQETEEFFKLYNKELKIQKEKKTKNINEMREELISQYKTIDKNNN